MIITDKEKLFLIFRRVLGAATPRCYLKKTVPKICFIAGADPDYIHLRKC